MQTRNVMNHTIFVLEEASPIRDALALLAQQEIKHIPIENAGKLTGIVSDRDLKIFLTNSANLDLPLSSIMSREIISITTEVTVGQAAKLMLQHNINALPIVDHSGQLLGLVTSSDLLRLLVHHTKSLREKLPCCFSRSRNFILSHDKK